MRYAFWEGRNVTSIETKGKSVDEAIFNGLNELGVGIDEVEIDIIHEGSRGLFGFGKNAVVRLTLREEEPEEILSRCGGDRRK